MNAHVLRAITVMGPNDLRLIWRDGFFLSFIVLMMPLAGLLLRALAPWATEVTAQWVDLEQYYGLIVASMIVAGQPVLMGFVVGTLFVEERDQGTLLALQASPLSLRTFLGYRLLVAMACSVLLTIVGVYATGLVSASGLSILTSALLASLAVPVIAFVYAIYIKNKVQALMLLKPVQIWGGLPTLLFFVPTPWNWLASVLLPLYYPMRLLVGADQQMTQWWLVMPALIVPGIVIWWLLRRFERAVVA